MNSNTKTHNSQYEAKELLPIGLIVAIGAIFCRLPALGAWWSLDDWDLLARAANVIFSYGPSPRVFSQIVWWEIFYPIFGDNAQSWAFVRLLIFGGISWTTVRICKHIGMGKLPRLFAGLLVAASPLAFTPLYWASGVQTLLGALFALRAIDFALQNRTWPVLLLGAFSILSKENAILLPLILPFIFINKTWKHWLVIALLGTLAIFESWLVLITFNHTPGMPYALGNLQSVFTHLAGYGWWMLSPGIPYTIKLGLVELIAGLSLWLLWGIYSFKTWRSGDSVPAFLLISSLASIAPALALKTHHYPYMAFLAAIPFYILVAQLVASRFSFSVRNSVVISVVVLLLGFGLMEARISLRTNDGLPADPTVRNSSMSYAALKTIRTFKNDPIVILQPKLSIEGDSSRLLRPTPLYSALGGQTIVPMLALEGINLSWETNLSNLSKDVIVLVDAGPLLKYWGKMPQPLIYLALSDIAMGKYGEARFALRTAMIGSDTSMPFMYDESQLIFPPSEVEKNCEEFLSFLEHDSDINGENGAIIKTAVDLFDRCGFTKGEK
jgi:hypothetical protein